MRKSLLSIFIIVLIFTSSFYPINVTANDEIIIALNGKSYYSIFYGANESEIIKHAAEELAFYLEKISSAPFRVITSPGDEKNLIVIGKNNPLTRRIENEMEFDSIIADGFKILTYGDNIYIAGNIDRGTLYGVYYFLDHYLGVRWLSPDFEVIPSTNLLAVNHTDDIQNPRFLYREIFSGDTDDAYYRQHNLLNGCRGGTHREYMDYPPEINTWSKDAPYGGHNFQEIISPEYHYGGQVLAMSEEVRKEAADYFINKIASNDISPWYSFSQEDRGWQPDEESLKFAEKHGGRLSAPIVDLVINVTDRVRKVYPSAHLSTLAYQWSFMPPLDMKIPPYVMIEIAPIEANFGYPYNDTHNFKEQEAFSGWNEIASSLAIWDYITNFQNYLQPWPTIYPMMENIKYLSSLESLKSYFGEGAYNTQGAEFAYLRAWVASRLLWDPEQDYHNLINEFCDYYYGNASPYIKEYIELLHQSFAESNGSLMIKQPVTADYLNLDFIKKADELMEKADSCVDGIYSKHIHSVRLGVDMVILLRKHLYKHEAEERGEEWRDNPERKARFERYIREANITYYSEDLPVSCLLDAINITRIMPPSPGIAFGRKWIDFQDMDFSICCGATFIEDMNASDHGAVVYSGNEWAINLPMYLLPSGNWSLYAYVRADIKENAKPSDTAFVMGIYPGKEKEQKVYRLMDGKYHVFRFPLTVSKSNKIAWISCGNASKRIYVDRIVAVKKIMDTQPLGLHGPISNLFESYFLKILLQYFVSWFMDSISFI